MSNTTVNCQNCEQSHKENFEFCPHCGQKTNDELTIGVLFYNTISNYFSFDARFFKSFFPLMYKPGYLAKEFIKGKRLLYLHPAQMYLFIAVIFFFIFNFYVRDSRTALYKNMQNVLAIRTENIESYKSKILHDSLNVQSLLKPIRSNSKALGLDEEDLKIIDSISKSKGAKNNLGTSFIINEKEMDSLLALGYTDEQMYTYMGLEDDAGYFKRKIFVQGLKFYKTMGLGQIYQTFIDSIPIAMFFLLPIFAFLLKLLFYNKGRYSHHLVFGFYYFSFLFTVFSIVLGINYWVWDIPNWIDVLIALSTFIYLSIAIIKFYEQYWLLSLIKTGALTFLFLMLVLPFSFTILGVMAFLFY
ncbi:MAG: DUF3667 domain-containing protein [Winogradskyella sp.]